MNVVQAYYEAVNQADWQAVAGLISADFQHHVPGYPRGSKPFINLLSDYRAGFPDLQTSVVETIDNAERVVARTQTQGTHTGEFLGHAPTGRRFYASGIDIFTVADGHITERHSLFDTLAMLHQLGLR